MADYIPFVNSEKDCTILNKYYHEPHAIRVSREAINRLRNKIPKHQRLWLDPAVDAYDHVRAANWPKRRADWKDWHRGVWGNFETCFKSVPDYEVLLEEKPWLKKHEDKVNRFVSSLLDKCLEFEPAWISVPQLPLNSTPKLLNDCLARAAGDWRNAVQREVELVLPTIITGLGTLKQKHSRDKVLTEALERRRSAGAGGVWVVDTNLSDQNRNADFSKRYESLVEFHTNLKKRLPPGTTIIGGPYWGMNVVLWARGLCSNAAISLGTRYTYYISCGQARHSSIRIAIPPIRRWVTASLDLRTWLDQSLERIDTGDIAYKELLKLKQDFSILNSKDAAVDQIARFYARWLQKIQDVPPEGRSLAVYQDLSSAFVLGRQLPSLPKTSMPYVARKIRKAETVAEQLMLHCL